MKLLSVSNDAKTVKGEAKGYLTGVLYLAPAKLSGFEVCAKASEGCREVCLNTAGRGGFAVVQDSRVRKTRLFFEDREAFMALLVKDTEALIRKADREGLIPVLRPNGTSDIPFERVPCTRNGVRYANIMEAFPTLQMYDYTKRPNRKDLPKNYHLTFSLAEDNDMDALQAIENGMNVAAVFFKVPARYTFEGADHDLTVNVVDGDESDLRFLDPAGVVVGLKAKGKARKDTSGFVR